MKLTIGDKQILMRVVHLNPDEVKKEFPDLVGGTVLAKKNHKISKATVAELTYDGVTSRALSLCSINDSFNRRVGASRSLHAALLQHPSMNQKGNPAHKKLRSEIYGRMFRSEPSPYDSLNKLVKGKPDLAWAFLDLMQAIREDDRNIIDEIVDSISINIFRITANGVSDVE